MRFFSCALYEKATMAHPARRLRLKMQDGTQRNTKFFHVSDGYYFHRNAVFPHKVYFKCVFYERGCYARAVYSREGHFSVTQDHNHPADHLYASEMKLRKRILDRCRNVEYVSFRRIVAEERRRFPINVQRRVTLKRIRAAMQRIRRSLYPPPPQSLQQLTDILTDPRYRVITMSQDGEDNLHACSLTAPDGSHHIIFSSRRLLNFARTVNTLFSDGTFKVCPSIPGVYQIFTILTNWRNSIIPVAWVLMENKEQGSYESVLRIFRLLLGGAPNLTHVVTDYERALQNAWSVAFGNQRGFRLQGCFWHLVRAFIRRIKHTLQLRALLNNERYKWIIHLCCALPLLPLRHQRRGFMVILREAHQMGPRRYNRLRPFFEYLYDWWINHRLRRRWMCVSNSPHRTNNSCESFNRMLFNYVGVHHANIYNFLAALIAIEFNAFLDIGILQEGRNPSRRRRWSAIANDETILNLTNDLEGPHDNLDAALTRFLHRAVYTFRGVFDDAVQNL